jgi:manganese-transporting P-type ATPase
VNSPEIARVSLHVARPLWAHIYAVPFLCLYPLWAYAYYFKYDDWIKSEEWTFLGCVVLGAGHALSFLATRWSAGAKALITSSKVRATGLHSVLAIISPHPLVQASSIESADLIRIVPERYRGKGEMVPILRKKVCIFYFRFASNGNKH